jgi:hypothetical protein
MRNVEGMGVERIVETFMHPAAYVRRGHDLILTATSFSYRYHDRMSLDCLLQI